jgi:hypothetical protein
MVVSSLRGYNTGDTATKPRKKARYRRQGEEPCHRRSCFTKCGAGSVQELPAQVQTCQTLRANSNYVPPVRSAPRYRILYTCTTNTCMLCCVHEQSTQLHANEVIAFKCFITSLMVHDSECCMQRMKNDKWRGNTLAVLHKENRKPLHVVLLLLEDSPVHFHGLRLQALLEKVPTGCLPSCGVLCSAAQQR